MRGDRGGSTGAAGSGERLSPAPRGRVLAIGGSDCSGGAGIQADIRAITALGGQALTAITAITVQDAGAVHAVHPVAPAVVAAQIACVLDNPGVDAVKTGMLVDAPTIAAVAAVLRARGPGLNLVIDPVLSASSGGRLLEAGGLAALRGLFSAAALVTPNLGEAAVLCGGEVAERAQMRAAAAALLAMGARAVLIKGGHGAGPELTDLLLSEAGEACFSHPRVRGALRGTGCMLAAAVATGLAQGHDLVDAVGRAIAFVQRAIIEAPRGDAGCGAR